MPNPSKTEPCAVCGAPAVMFCRWPVERPVMVHHSELSMEDLIVTNGGRHLHPLTVERFRYKEGSVTYPVTMYALNYGRDRYFLFYRVGWETVRVLRREPCGASVCELHHREVGEHRVYCQSHWDSWKEVA